MPFGHQDLPHNFYARLHEMYLIEESDAVASLINQTGLTIPKRQIIEQRASALALQARDSMQHGQVIDQLLQEYGLSTAEGVTLMRLCEALIRTPDAMSAFALIRDKIGGADWAGHAGKSSSMLVNLSTRGLQLCDVWIEATGGKSGQNLLTKLGDPVLRQAMQRAMSMMGDHFVLGSTIEKAMNKAACGERSGYAYSYDMLGEAAYTEQDAARYFAAYLHAIKTLAASVTNYTSIAEAPGISVKLSALHPRYEYAQRDICVPALISRVVELAMIAKTAGIGLTIDAEEADRLELSLEIIAGVLSDPNLKGWNGLGMVVQAYQRRAPAVIAALTEMTQAASSSITIRLVKGAYWDSEIKRAQELGLTSYPVFTRKENTDVSFLACARQLFDAGKTVFPQFATHNAHTAAAVMELAGTRRAYEFQRLYGMGDTLHDALMAQSGVRCRIYAPVGQHEDLLPYLVRRLLENGANSSFVNQLLDTSYPVDEIVRDPILKTQQNEFAQHPAIPEPTDLFHEQRLAATGLDLTQSCIAAEIEQMAEPYGPISVGSIVNGSVATGDPRPVMNPATEAVIGSVYDAPTDLIDLAIQSASVSNWGDTTSSDRARCLLVAADLLEQERDHFLRLCVIEAGKTYADAVAELREAVDFCRYYAHQCTNANVARRKPLGTVACISPWNFPLAIFLGQITAALAVGNTVIAKPAEQTPIIAYEAIRLLHRAGIPADAVQLIIGDGPLLGAYLVAAPQINGVCFTGSTRTAKHIAASLADTGRPLAPLIAETGGLNAMLVDSTALLEQAVSDVVASAFQSAGQRCSACRVVCVQEDIADDFIRMLTGAMALLTVGDPKNLSTDVGPVIDQQAYQNLSRYITEKRGVFPVLFETELPSNIPAQSFIAPIALEIPSISSLTEEVFGPVLHVFRFKAGQFDQTVSNINALGYGLTMGLHTRIDNRVDTLAETADVGNLYVNRNQIGAVVGVQPFGGDRLSGTGPKAGGPHYLLRLSQRTSAKYPNSSPQPDCLIQDNNRPHAFDPKVIATARHALSEGQPLDLGRILKGADQYLKQLYPGTRHCIRHLLAKTKKLKTAAPLPGPTGEINTLTLKGRGVLLCLGGDDRHTIEKQILISIATGNCVIALAPPDAINDLSRFREAFVQQGLPAELFTVIANSTSTPWLQAGIDGVVCDGAQRLPVATELPHRDGPLLPVLSWRDDVERFYVERTLTINTTAAGGNASLLAM